MRLHFCPVKAESDTEFLELHLFNFLAGEVGDQKLFPFSVHCCTQQVCSSIWVNGIKSCWCIGPLP